MKNLTKISNGVDNNKKTILVTGGAGFVGHHVVEHIYKNTDWNIIILDCLNYAGNLNKVSDIFSDIGVPSSERLRIVWHDLRAPISETTHHLLGKFDYCIHAAAESHVDRSLKDSIPFVMSNVVGTANLLEYFKKYQPQCKTLLVSTDEVFGSAPPDVANKENDKFRPSNPYSGSKAAQELIAFSFAHSFGLSICITRCHDEKTRIFTENGFRRVDEVKKGDLVWVLKDEKNKQGNLVLEPIENIFVYPNYKGEMIRLKNHQIDNLITPNHRVMLKDRNRNEFWYREAKDMLNDTSWKRYYIPLKGRWLGQNRQKRKLKYFSINEKKLHFNVKKIPEKLPLKALFQLFGWYISEGSITRGTVSLTQENETGREEIISVLKKLGLRFKIRKRNIEIYSVQLVKILESCGKGAKEKRIPKWVLEYPPNYLKYLFDSLMRGDGSINRTSKVFYTTSEKLVEQFCELVLKLGFSPRISRTKTWNPKHTRLSESYIVRIRKGMGSLERRSIKKVNYKGKVWCLGTKSGNFFVERDGLISCSGNSTNIFGERQHPEKFIPKTIRAILNNEKVVLHGKGNEDLSSRCWIHARNVSDALLFLLEKSESKEAYHIVGEERSVLEIANWICEVIKGRKLKDEEIQWVDYEDARPGHDKRYLLSGEKLLKMGWKPPVDLEKSIKKTVKWSLENPQWLNL